jgi:hypothetical protein
MGKNNGSSILFYKKGRKTEYLRKQKNRIFGRAVYRTL